MPFARCIPVAILLLLVALAGSAWADEPVSNLTKSFVVPKISAEVDGRAQVQIRLEPDKAACEKHYGKGWEAACNQDTGLAGKPVQGVSITPEVKGKWSFSSDRTLVFEPEDFWTPGQAYSVTLSGATFGDKVISSQTRLSFKARPPYAKVNHFDFIHDPDLALETMALSANISFNYPMNVGTPEKPFRFAVVDSARSGELDLEAPELVWNKDGLRVNISAKVRKLPPAASLIVAMDVDKALKTARDNMPLANTEALENVILPAQAGFLKLIGLGIFNQANAKLDNEQILAVDFNAKVPLDDLTKHMTVLLLPRTNTPEATKPFEWDRFAPSNDDLAKSEPISVEPLSAPGKGFYQSHRFKIKAEPGRYVLVNVDSKLAVQNKYTMGADSRAVFKAPAISKHIEFMQPGTILSLSGDKKLSLYCMDLDSVHWSVSRVRPEFINYLTGVASWDETASIRSPETGLEFDTMSEVLQGDIPLTRERPGAAQFAALDLGPLFSKENKGIFALTVEGRGDDHTVEQTRFVVLTDLAIMVKKNADQTRDVFVSRLSTGKPVRWASVEVIGKNGVALFSRETDSDGHVHLPSLDGFTREKTPVAIVAQRSNDLSFLPLNDNSLVIDYSRYPISGQRSRAADLNALVFSQRGIYRPGETLHFGAIVKTGDWKKNLTDLPVEGVLYDPAGRKVMEKTLTLGPSGMLELSQALPDSVLTGNYRFDLVMIDPDNDDLVLGSRTVRVEEFQPDTMKIGLKFSPEQTAKAGWVIPKDMKALVDLNNLYGTPAIGHRVIGKLHLTRTSFSFPRYRDYSFYDATLANSYPIEKTLAEQETDQQGQVVFALPMDEFREGTYALTFTAEGFAKGAGRSVTAERSILVSPLEYVLGFQTTAYLGYISQGRETTVDFLAVGPDLEPRPVEHLNVTISTEEYTTSLVRDGSGQYRYDSVAEEKKVREDILNIGPKGTSYKLPTDTPGDYVLRVTDGKGKVVSQFNFTVAGDNPRSFDSTMESVMRLRLDKTDYKAGDAINLYVTLPYDGAGLVTIEREKVMAWKWITAKAGDSVHRIDIPKDFQGKGYVNVSFARSLLSREIFLNPYTYAVEPFSVGVERRDLGLEVKVPDKIKPGQNLDISYQAKEKGQVIIYVVDEGILQLTRYALPSPLTFFLRDRALEVESRQFFDLVMPEYSILRKVLPAFGGDLLRGGLDPRHNPFKRKTEPPVQYWSGIIDVDKKGGSLSVPIPQYFNGRLRVMVVGASTERVASAETGAAVRGDLIVSPQLPVTVTPGDQFEATALIANNLEDSGQDMEVTVKIEADPGLTLVGTPPGTVKVSQGRDGLIAFTLKAGQHLGDNSVRIIATAKDKDGGQVQASRSMSLSIRPASARMSAIRGGYGDQPETTVPLTRRMYPFQAVVEASASSLPMAATQGLARYLETYPYGCTEQLISKAMPQVTLLTRPEFMADKPGQSRDKTRKEAEQLIITAIESIRARMTYQGLCMWPGSYADEDPLLTAYAGDFLLMAREASFSVSDYTLNEILNTLNRMVVRAEVNTLTEARSRAYALWVLTRSGQVTSQEVSGLVRTLEAKVKNWKSDVTASLLAACYQMMRQDKEADDLIAGYTVSPKNFWDKAQLFDSLAAQSLHLTILSKSFPGRLNNPAVRELVNTAIDLMEKQQYSSFSAAQMVRAIGAYSSAMKPDAQTTTIWVKNESSDLTELPTSGDMIKTAQATSEARELVFRQSGSSGVYWQVFTEGFDVNPPAQVVSDGLVISRAYLLDNKPLTDGQVEQGQELTVLITARSIGGPVANVAITDLLPGGFEMVIARGEADPEAATDSDSDDDQGGGAALNEQVRVPGLTTPAMRLAYTDRREDRMIVFADLTTSDSVFAYKIKAINTGQFVLPPVYAEAMYDRALRANSAAGKIVVKEAKPDAK